MSKSASLLFTLLIISCSSTSSSDAQLFQESVKLHEESLIIADSVEAKLSKLSVISLDSVELLIRDLALWRTDLIEVPGHEHQHADHHTHDHTPVNVTPSEMLDIQKDLRQRIENIKIRCEALTAKK